MKKTKIHLYFLACILLFSMPVLAQQTGRNIITFSTSPIKYYNINNNTLNELQPDTTADFDPENQSGTWEFHTLSHNYYGQLPVFAYQDICDRNGEPLAFIIDNFIYNKDGKAFYYENLVPYTLEPDYDSPIIDPYNSNYYSIFKNIIVVPKPNSCNKFYIIYAYVRGHDTNKNVNDPILYYKELTYINNDEIELSEAFLFNTDYQHLEYTGGTGCGDSHTFNITVTEINENDYLLVVQLLGLMYVYEINQTINLDNYKTIYPPISQLRSPLITGGFFRTNPVLRTLTDSILFIDSYQDAELNGYALRYVKFPKNFDSISQENVSFKKTAYTGGYKIHGLELSPDNETLYVTFEDSCGISYFDLSDYLQNTSAPPYISNTLTTDCFNRSDLSLINNNKIIAVSDGQLYEISNPNTPTLATVTPSTIINQNSIIYNYTGGYYLTNQCYKFPYQIDQSDYTTNYPPAQYTQPDWATIGANETWTPGIGNNPFNSETGIITFADDFEIPSGKYIQIENMEFHFADDKKAIINTGSTLSLVNSKLSSADHCDQTTMWGGVLVKGDANADQSAANQGRFKMDAGSEISNAVYAVKVESGAVCLIYGGEIKNNVYGVYFNPYIHPQIPAYNASIIQNATFETNRALNSGGPNFHIRFYGVNGVDINLCTLTNTRDNTVRADFRGQGLYTYNADFTMSNCDINGFYYGAKVYGSSTPSIIDCDFSNNLRGVLMKDVLLADVRNNTFNGDYDFPIRKDELFPNPYPYEYYNYSLYIAGDGISSTIHELKGNAITSGRLGLLLYNTGESATQIKDNSFNNISGASNVSAAIVMGKNSNYNGSDYGNIGTEFRCNSFFQNTYAMSIVDGNMRKYQGEHNASSGEEYAGNSFDHYGTSTERDFYVDASIASYLDIPLYEYYSHLDSSYKILNFTNSKISNMGHSFYFTADDCTEDSGGGGGIVIKGKSVGESIGDIETLDSEISLKSFELSELTDNGETYIMLSEVENASTTNSTEVATELSELDGFISDEVTLTYMQNSATGEFDKAGALLANSPLPSAAKNEIDNMEMNSTLKTIIKAGQNGKNSREIKEAEIASLKQTRGLIVKEMAHRVITSDSLSSETDELITFLTNDDQFSSKVHLLNLYKAKGRYQDVGNTLNTLRNEIQNTDIDRMTEMEDYLDLQEILLSIEIGEFDPETVVSDNLVFLQNLAGSKNTAGEIQAQVLLEQFGETRFLETVKLPEVAVNTKSMAFVQNGENPAVHYDNIIRLYPNPTRDYFSIEYALVDFNGSECIEIYSNKGSLIDRVSIPYAIGTYRYEKHLPVGNYIVKVGNNYSQKLSIF